MLHFGFLRSPILLFLQDAKAISQEELDKLTKEMKQMDELVEGLNAENAKLFSGPPPPSF